MQPFHLHQHLGAFARLQLPPHERSLQCTSTPTALAGCRGKIRHIRAEPRQFLIAFNETPACFYFHTPGWGCCSPSLRPPGGLQWGQEPTRGLRGAAAALGQHPCTAGQPKRVPRGCSSLLSSSPHSFKQLTQGKQINRQPRRHHRLLARRIAPSMYF